MRGVSLPDAGAVAGGSWLAAAALAGGGWARGAEDACRAGSGAGEARPGKGETDEGGTAGRSEKGLAGCCILVRMGGGHGAVAPRLLAKGIGAFEGCRRWAGVAGFEEGGSGGVECEG